MSAGDSTALGVGSITLIDSSITNTPVGILTGFTATSLPDTANTLIIENVSLNNVPVAVQEVGGATLLAGGTLTITAWGQGNQYTPNGPERFQGPITPNTRPESLLSGSNYYTRSKPQYETLPLSQFSSVRSAGATGKPLFSISDHFFGPVLMAMKYRKRCDR
jgi:glucan 1,3-beta-glucosidase